MELLNKNCVYDFYSLFEKKELHGVTDEELSFYIERPTYFSVLDIKDKDLLIPSIYALRNTYVSEYKYFWDCFAGILVFFILMLVEIVLSIKIYKFVNANPVSYLTTVILAAYIFSDTYYHRLFMPYN